MAPMQIKSIAPHACVLSYDDDDTGERVERRFVAASGGGYVREAHRNGQITNPCARLANCGDTLRWSGAGMLADLIRGEYRKMRAAEKAERARR